jgi:hypothetical protein
MWMWRGGGGLRPCTTRRGADCPPLRRWSSLPPRAQPGATLARLRAVVFVAALAVVLLPEGARGQASSASRIISVQHGPQKDVYKPYDDPKIIRLSTTGINQDAGFQPFGQWVYIGCFSAPQSLTRDSEMDIAYEPTACVTDCIAKMVSLKPHQIIAGVSRERCGCSGDMANWDEVSEDLCSYTCAPHFLTNRCGGPPLYWSVFKQYENQVLSTQGAFDPWRSIFYQVVTMPLKMFYRAGDPALSPDRGNAVERYYLHAINTENGKELFQYQKELPGQLHGLQFDLDTSRLVGVMTEARLGRTNFKDDWKYWFFTINMNTSNPLNPIVNWTNRWRNNELAINTLVNRQYLAFTGVSAILSRNEGQLGLDTGMYITVQARAGATDQARDLRHRVYFIDIEAGQVRAEHDLGDFQVLQLFTNEKYGDVTAVGWRIDGISLYTKIAQVQFNEIEQRRVVYWTYNPIAYLQLVPEYIFQDLSISPGQAVSDHLYNKSYIWYRNYSTDYTMNRTPDVAPNLPMLMEVNIRLRQYDEWCDPLDCKGTVQFTVPYSQIYNKEPLIPLSIAAPQIQTARFSPTGAVIFVAFDKATLKGAKPRDINGDQIPDLIDFMTQQPSGNWDCSQIFDVNTITLIGAFPDVYCVWDEGSQKISIYISANPDISPINVGDQVFLLPDVIYATPDTINQEYSMAASGGMKVSNPDPLDPPTITLAGATEVDNCAPVEITAGDTRNTGGRGKFEWSLEKGEDMGNQFVFPDGFNKTKLNEFRRILANASLYNAVAITIPSEVMRANSKYFVKLTVTSRWGLNASDTLELIKKQFAAPVISIPGEATRITNRSQQLTLVGIGIPSSCDGNAPKLVYLWTETSGKIAADARADLQWMSRSLVLPPMTLDVSTDQDVDYNVYNFTVSCWTECQGSTEYCQLNPPRVSTATVGVLVRRSQVAVVFSKEDRIHKRGQVLVLDARESIDMDEPLSAGMTFKGDFFWYCMDPDRIVCYPPQVATRRLKKGRRSDLSFGELYRYERILQATAPEGAVWGVKACKIDVSQTLTVAFKTFSMPVFDAAAGYPDSVVCDQGRGTLLLDTSNYKLGEYLFTVEIVSYFGNRKASQSIRITMTDVDVPQLSLVKLPDRTKYPVSAEIRFAGTVESASTIDPAANILYTWRIYVWVVNPQFNRDKYLAAQNDPSQTYSEQEFVFKDQTENFDFSDPAKFLTDAAAPNLVVKSNVLKESNTYKFRLEMTVTTGSVPVTGIVETQVITAGKAPFGGSLTCIPENASMLAVRTLVADNWKGDDEPLTYKFGYLKTVGGAQNKIEFAATDSPTKQLDVVFPALGEPSTNYSFTIYVDVTSVFGAVTMYSIQVQSRLPENLSAEVNNQLNKAKDAAPEDVAPLLTATLELAAGGAPPPPPGAPPAPITPAQTALFEDVLGTLDVAIAGSPPTLQVAVQQASVINKVINSGMKNLRAVQSLETSIGMGVSSGLYDLSQGTTLFETSFDSIGSILPDVGSGADLLPAGRVRGQSIAMDRYRTTLPSNTGTKYMDELEHMVAYMDKWLDQPAGRQVVNHPEVGQSRIVGSCRTAYCDRVFSACMPNLSELNPLFFMCCNEPNDYTECHDPPCWFLGNKCPTTANYGAFDASTDAYSDTRRLSPDRNEQQQGRHGDSARRERLLQQRDGAAMSINPNISMEANIWRMEQDEKIMLADIRKIIKDKNTFDQRYEMNDMRKELIFQSMDKAAAIEARDIKRMNEKSYDDDLLEAERQVSQIITRAAVLRDTICKAGIVQITIGETMRFSNGGFTIWFGKTRNLSKVQENKLIFPDRFAVPPTAPEDPAPDNPISAFSFIYLEYTKNIYGWSSSAPPGNETKTITMIVMRASTKDFAVKNESEPIRVFADKSLFSSALCLYWDRFAANTAGGGWSVRGVMNDGDGGCLTTHLSDLGLFLDGRMAVVEELGQASSIFVEQTLDVGTNYSQIAILGFLLAISAICALWGYIRDELMREQGRVDCTTYQLNGDGVTAPKSVDDPIAYSKADHRDLFLALTYWKVIRRDHALISPLKYHEKYTRPQRVLVLLVLITGVFAINATISGVGDEGLISQGQYVASGVISGLLIFPQYVLVAMMFASRPFARQKRLVRKRTDTAPIEAIAKARNEAEAKASMKPQQFFRMPPGPVQDVGGNSMLSLPPPTMPRQFPGLPPPVASSPPPPALAHRAGGMPGLPGAPPLPVAGMSYDLPGLPALSGPPPGGPGGIGAGAVAKNSFPSLPGLGDGGLPSLPPLPKLQAMPGTGAGLKPPPPPKNPPQIGYPGYSPQRTPPGGGSPRTPPSLRNNAIGFDVEEPAGRPNAIADEPAHNAPPPSSKPPPGTRTAVARASLPPKAAVAKAAAATPASSSNSCGGDVEAAACGARELHADPQHTMMPGLPPLSGPPGLPPGTPPGSQPPTPTSLMPGRLDNGTPRTPSMHSSMPPTDRSMIGMPSIGPPPLPKAKGITRGIVHRGAPPVGMPPPFKPPPGSGTTSGGVPPPPSYAPPGVGALGVPLPPYTGPPPSGVLSGISGAAQFEMHGLPARPPPPPPPPPKEDDAAFLRRTRLGYMEKAHRHHQEMLIQEGQETHWEAPEWAYSMTMLMPYVACCTCIMLHIFIHMTYAVKFGNTEEEYYTRGTIIGLSLILFPLELVRSAVTTIVELRKYEIRRALAGGDYLQSRIRQLGGKRPPPVLTPKKAPEMRPAMPKMMPQVPTVSPPPPPPLPQRLPVAPSSTAPWGSSNSGNGPGMLPPLDAGSSRSGTPRSLGGSGTLMPGRLDQSRNSPQMAFGPGGAPPPPPRMPPGAHPTPLVQSLNQRMKERVAPGVAPAPPSSPPGSRPSSAGRVSSAPRPPVPPPSGTLAMTRNKARNAQGLK